MYQVIIIVHVLLGLTVIGFVLIQQGKGADAGAAFGSASSGSVFGAQGASSFLSRTTAILATLFFATSLGLAILVGYEEGELDLMDTPEVEELFTDLPLVNGGESTSESESIPVIADDVPGSIEEDVSKLVDDLSKKTQSTVDAVPVEKMEQAPAQIDAISKEIQSAVETTENKAEAFVEQNKSAVSDLPENVLETEVISE